MTFQTFRAGPAELCGAGEGGGLVYDQNQGPILVSFICKWRINELIMILYDSCFWKDTYTYKPKTTQP